MIEKYTKSPTEREKVVLGYAAAFNIQDWSLLYLASRPKPMNEYVTSSKAFRHTVSEWKNNYRVKAYYLEMLEKHEKLIQVRIDEALTKYKTEQDSHKQTPGNAEDATEAVQTGEALETAEAAEEVQAVEAEPRKPADKAANSKSRTKPIDFTDKAQLLDFLNSQANAITDDKLRTDYIKMIADLVRMKAEEAPKSEIRRFYVPLRCQDCELYTKASERLKKG